MVFFAIASAQVLGEWVKSERETFTMGGERYQGGRWIDILYGPAVVRWDRSMASAPFRVPR